MQILNRHFPTLLKLWRNSSNASPLSQKEYTSVSNALLELQRGLTGDRQLAGAGYMQKNSLLGAYLLYYWPVTFLQVQNALKTAGIRFKKEINLLDLGSGPGPAGISVCEELKYQKTSKINVTIVDYSGKALSLAEKIYHQDFKGITVKKVESNLEKEVKVLKEKTGNHQYDVIVMSHALNEMWKDDADADSKRKVFLDEVCSLLSEDGILFLMEPALLKTSRSLINLRDYLIEKGLFVVSPCSGNSKCPVLDAGENITCHGEYPLGNVPVVEELAKRTKLDRTSVKMSFFIFSRKHVEKTNVYTVVSDGMLNKSGRVRYLLCDGKQRIPCSAKKDDVHAKETGFFNLKRYEKIELLNPEIRGDNKDAFGISKETAIAHPLWQRDSHIC